MDGDCEEDGRFWARLGRDGFHARSTRRDGNLTNRRRARYWTWDCVISLIRVDPSMTLQGPAQWDHGRQDIRREGVWAGRAGMSEGASWGLDHA